MLPTTQCIFTECYMVSTYVPFCYNATLDCEHLEYVYLEGLCCTSCSSAYIFNMSDMVEAHATATDFLRGIWAIHVGKKEVNSRMFQPRRSSSATKLFCSWWYPRWWLLRYPRENPLWNLRRVICRPKLYIEDQILWSERHFYYNRQWRVWQWCMLPVKTPPADM